MLPKTDESLKVPQSVLGHEELGRTSKWCMVAALFYSEHSKCFLLQAHADTEVDRLGTSLGTPPEPQPFGISGSISGHSRKHFP